MKNGLPDLFHQQDSTFKQQKEARNIGRAGTTLSEVLAPNATVMSWRGEEGGVAAAQQHHKVILTPGKYVILTMRKLK